MSYRFPAIDLDIESNPNCKTHGYFTFQPLESGGSRPVKALHMGSSGKEEWWDVVGVGTNGAFIQAYAHKIGDSGAGYGFLIYSGSVQNWGIRLKPSHLKEDWNLQSLNQKGEAYIVFAEESDILYQS